MTAATTPHKLAPVVTVRNGNPASALPMGNLSARAMKELAPRRNAFGGVSIEPAGQGLAREVMRRASI